MSRNRIIKLYNDILKKLMFSQYEEISGGDMSYHSKIKQIKLITQDKQIHVLCNDLQEELYRNKLVSGYEW